MGSGTIGIEVIVRVLMGVEVGGFLWLYPCIWDRGCKSNGISPLAKYIAEVCDCVNLVVATPGASLISHVSMYMACMMRSSGVRECCER